MSNYIVEGGLDFYSELFKDDDTETNENICLISGLPLMFNSISLDCGHKFNYDSLFKDVVSQKQGNCYGIRDNVRLSVNQFKCPYCRTVYNKLLPYTPMNGFTQHITGVNCPLHMCMEHKQCTYKMIKGKNAGHLCERHAFESEKGVFCPRHLSMITNKMKKEVLPFEWTSEMQDMYKTNKVDGLRNILKGRGLKICGTKREIVYRLVTSMKNTTMH